MVFARGLLDEREFRRRNQLPLAELIAKEPNLLRDHFQDGAVADAFAAALAALLARQRGLAVPAWMRDEGRILEDPWFPVVGTPALHG